MCFWRQSEKRGCGQYTLAVVVQMLRRWRSLPLIEGILDVDRLEVE
ncbi:hypothetical protein [Coleofasciculus sp. H7-2]